MTLLEEEEKTMEDLDIEDGNQILIEGNNYFHLLVQAYLQLSVL
jgi:hypothetical protein